MYVMTSEYGSASQLEKIDMLDFAQLVVINKFDRKGSEDAYRDVCKQFQRKPGPPLTRLRTRCRSTEPSRPTSTTRAWWPCIWPCWTRSRKRPRSSSRTSFKKPKNKFPMIRSIIVPPERTRYLAEIASTVRDYKAWAREQAELARMLWAMDKTLGQVLKDKGVGGRAEETSSPRRSSRSRRRWWPGWTPSAASSSRTGPS